MPSANEIFGSHNYQRHNARRLEHLATLGLPIAGRDVLELGAGIGDHTGFFLDRGCKVTAVEVRAENLEIFKARIAALDWHDRVRLVEGNMEEPAKIDLEPHSIVYSYGLLYHLREVEVALAWSAEKARDLLLLETCVSFGEDAVVAHVEENSDMASQSFCGTGSRPTRRWIYNELSKHFNYVYLPTTQPWHEEFPLDWQSNQTWRSLARAIFIASRKALQNPLLLSYPPLKQRQI